LPVVYSLYVLAGVALLVLLLMAVRWFVSAPPAQLAVLVKWAVGFLGVVLILFLVVRGQFLLVPLVGLATLWPMLKRVWSQVRNAGGPAQGQRSTVETPYLRAELDHDSGAMEGIVLAGRFRGATLAELGLLELMSLLAECRIHDPDAAAVLEAYLDRVRPDWRDTAEAAAESGAGGAGGSTSSAAMTREEAYRILGLEPGADEKAVRDAHRRLMLKLHPDQGGSSYLAAKINQARDLLCGE
jgi:hypothetical protein